MWEYLKTKVLYTPTDIRSALRASTLRTKHYDSVRVFCDVFTTFRCRTYDHQSTYTILRNQFKWLHRVWQQSGGEHFFSYDWLIRKFLEELDHPLLVYLKPCTSKRRERRYVDKMAFIRSRSGSTNSYLPTAVPRSRCDAMQKESHPCRRLWDEGPFAFAVSWARGGTHACVGASHEPSHAYSFGTPKDGRSL